MARQRPTRIPTPHFQCSSANSVGGDSGQDGRTDEKSILGECGQCGRGPGLGNVDMDEMFRRENWFQDSSANSVTEMVARTDEQTAEINTISPRFKKRGDNYSTHIYQ
ncbi:hypothetical protein DPMN_122323 [Dreissena polymorpha]|uniref:Uncharacterized protein n=1 Tax=Dreissena polymorpha TaxID=45954 RepID=A0A9D4JU19_DREPO|nr:hypothetical protein DPMN_122323 [Dreissena polymorpha]